ncbi:MAG: hypothetical protein K6F17_02590 [Lachnospiraceae bacterium]|nr:hypothetical protein [Lachnospiraceae bacterium]
MDVKQEIKRLNFLHVLTIFIYVLIMPLLILLLYKSDPAAFEIKSKLLNLLNLTLPVTAILLPIAFSQDAMEGAGNELLYIGHKIKIKNYLCAVFVSLTLSSVSFVISHLLFDLSLGFTLGEYARFCIIGAFLVSMYYMILYISASYMATNLIVGTYVIVCSYILRRDILVSYYSDKCFDKTLFLRRYLLYLILIPVFFMIGRYKNRHFEKYS